MSIAQTYSFGVQRLQDPTPDTKPRTPRFPVQRRLGVDIPNGAHPTYQSLDAVDSSSDIVVTKHGIAFSGPLMAVGDDGVSDLWNTVCMAIIEYVAMQDGIVLGYEQVESRLMEHFAPGEAILDAVSSPAGVA